jgi:hypothetical protein
MIRRRSLEGAPLQDRRADIRWSQEERATTCGGERATFKLSIVSVTGHGAMARN